MWADNSLYEPYLSTNIERLEDRRLLAGNVDVALVGDDLVITGDAEANSIFVEHPSLGDYKVGSDNNTTTINGGNAAITFSGGIDRVHIRLHDGDDQLRLSGIFEGDLIIDGGDGNNTVMTFGADTVQVNDDLHIRNGDGMDTFNARIAYVLGNFRVTNGDGGSLTNLFDGGKFSGQFRVSNGDGTDTLQFIGGPNDHVEGNAVIDHGRGHGHTTITSIHFRDSLNLRGDDHNTLSMVGESVDGRALFDFDSSSIVDLQTMRFGDRLTILGGGGWQEVTVASVVVGGLTKFDHGGGASVTEVSLSDLQGGLRVHQGNAFSGFSPVTLANMNVSNDTIIESNEFMIGDSFFDGDVVLQGARGLERVLMETVVVDGSLALAMRAGLTVSATETELRDVVVGRQLRYIAAHGTDNLDFATTVVGGNLNVQAGRDGGSVSAHQLSIGGNLSVTNQTGAFDVRTERLVVGGTTTIVTGRDADQVDIDDSVFEKRFSLNTGAGHDMVSIEGNVTGTSMIAFFGRSVTINLGAGADTLQVGLNGDNQASAIFDSRLRVIGGSGIDFASLWNNGNTFGGAVVDSGMEGLT